MKKLLCLMLVFCFYGCASKIYWEEEWKYDRTDKDIPRSQSLKVVSTPPASLEIDGHHKGQTPMNITLPYYATEVKLIKNKYKESGDKKEVIEQKEQTESITQKTPHIFHLQAPGYHDVFMPVIIPHEKEVLEVKLEKAGIINDIECHLKVEAREEYFPDIERVISKYALQHRVLKDTENPIQLSQQNIYAQKFHLIVKDSVAFDGLVNALLSEAEEKDFVFDILNARNEATFSTNVLETDIEHIVRGRIRPESDLYLIQKGNSFKIEDIQPDGRFGFSVNLSPTEKYVYLISKYKDILIVYKRIDVYSQKEEEFTRDQFISELGITEAKLTEMIRAEMKVRKPSPTVPESEVKTGEPASEKTSSMQGTDTTAPLLSIPTEVTTD